MTVGSLIREKRLERGWSLRRLQDESGVTYQTIKNIEDGINAPVLTTFTKLAQALDLDETDLAQLLSGRVLVDTPVAYETVSNDSGENISNNTDSESANA